MKAEFPGAVPEIPVSNVDRAADYYRNNLGWELRTGGWVPVLTD
jgi:predicted enzyme related to lactoylglutathione lyase